MGGRHLGPPLRRAVVLTAGLALVALAVGWLLTDPETSGRKGREAQRLTAQLLGKNGDPSLASADDVLRYLAAHRDDAGLVSYVLSPGGQTGSDLAVRHQHLTPAPPATKLTHLAAYAAAVGDRRLNPAEPVKTGTLDQLVSSMIVKNDDAAADHLRTRLGNPARTPVAPAALADLLTAIVSDRYISPEVSGIARRHLEWPTRNGPLNARVTRFGSLNGALPGVLSEASYAVGPGGLTRVTVLSIREVPPRAWGTATRARALQQFALRLASDPTYVEKVRRSL